MKSPGDTRIIPILHPYEKLETGRKASDMKRIPLILTVVVTVIGLPLLAAGCAGASTSTSTTASGETTTTGIGLGSTTTGSDQGTDTTTVDRGGTTTGSDQSTDTTTQDTSTTLASDTTTTAPSAGSASPAITHQQTEPRFAYAGTWKKVSGSSASGGSFALADSSGASLTITFIGTHLAWIAKESPAYGQAKVTVDGGAAHTVDLYNATTVWKHTVWQTGTLKNGAHTVVISWTGKKRAAATGTNINVDAIQVTGVLTGRYQQSNTKFSYSGHWNTTSNSSASGGSFTYADTSGASVTIHFTGIDLAWITKTGPAYGQAKITVDGTKTYTVNLYSASTVWQKRVWSTGILAMGAHTVVIHWTGTKSKAASGTNIGVDAFDVTGTLD